MSVIIKRSPFASTDLAVKKSLLVMSVFAIGIYRRSASIVVDGVCHCLKVIRIAAQPCFAKVIDTEPFWNRTFEKFVHDTVNPQRVRVIEIDVAVSAVIPRIATSNPEPATRVRLDNDFISHSLWKSANVELHKLALIVARNCCGGGFLLGEYAPL